MESVFTWEWWWNASRGCHLDVGFRIQVEEGRTEIGMTLLHYCKEEEEDKEKERNLFSYGLAIPQALSIGYIGNCWKLVFCIEFIVKMWICFLLQEVKEWLGKESKVVCRSLLILFCNICKMSINLIKVVVMLNLCASFHSFRSLQESSRTKFILLLVSFFY